MPDICDLILDDHAEFRRRFAEIDEHRQDGAERLSSLWDPLGALLDLHAAAEEDAFYPRLLRRGRNASEETTDAIADHNRIRDAVADASRATVGSDGWWDAVNRARTENSDHMAEEERGALADFRANATSALRDEIGARFAEFERRHAGGRDLEVADSDPESYVAEESPSKSSP